MENKVCQE